MCSWILEQKDIPCSLADILRHSFLYFLLVKLLLLTSGCFSHSFSFFFTGFLLSHAQFIPWFPLIASGQTMGLFVSHQNVCLWGRVLNAWSSVIRRCWWGQMCEQSGFMFSGCIYLLSRLTCNIFLLLFFFCIWQGRKTARSLGEFSGHSIQDAWSQPSPLSLPWFGQLKCVIFYPALIVMTVRVFLFSADSGYSLPHWVISV